MAVPTEESNWKIFYKNFLGGLGWAAGTTIGFALFVALLSYIINALGGIPIIGDVIARIIESTTQALRQTGRF